jgi:multiple sugar transport system permease protein
VAAPLAAVLALSAAPLAVILWLSLRRHMPVFGISEFVGLENYRFLLEDPRFLGSLGNTLYVTVSSVGCELLLGLGIALLLRRLGRGRGALQAAMLVPWMLPTVVAAWAWEWILNPGFGLLNHVLGLHTNWLGDPVLAIHAVILADVWKSTPFAALLLFAGLQAIPEDLYRAARVDGAGAWRTFRAVTLPLLAPAVAVVLLFRTLDAFRIFDVVYVLTGGGPADTTETLSVHAHDLFFQALDFGTGSAVCAISFVCMALWSLLCVRLVRGGNE